MRASDLREVWPAVLMRCRSRAEARELFQVYCLKSSVWTADLSTRQIMEICSRLTFPKRNAS